MKIHKNVKVEEQIAETLKHAPARKMVQNTSR